MEWRGWTLFSLTFLLLTLLLGVSLYYQELLFSVAISLFLVLATDRTRAAFTRNKHKVLKERRFWYGLGLLLLWGCGIALFVSSAQQLSGVITTLQSTEMQNVDDVVGLLSGKFPLTAEEQQYTKDRIQWLRGHVRRLLVRLQDDTTFLFFYGPIVLPLTIGLYLWRRPLVRASSYLIPRACRAAYVRTLQHTRERLYDFIGAKVLQSAIVGGLCAIGFGLAQLKGWFLLGMLAGALNLIPYAGPFLGALPPLLVALLAGNLATLIYVGGTLIVAQLTDNLYLNPIMIADKVRIHPLLAIGVTILGSYLYGALGLFFAIPVTIGYEDLLSNWYRELRTIYDEPVAEQ